jgi:ribosomal-protein-alanine N-acetyltransferase
MIREAKLEDINRINEIGLLIKNDFANVYKLEDTFNQDYSHILVYDEDGIKGFLQYEDHFEITDIINIAVDKSNQHEGVGYKLIEYLINNTNADKIMLEVRDDNQNAISLYKKCGFVEIHRRVKYYGDVDAIIMERMVEHV